MITPNVTEVFVKGTPRERGISYGTQAKDAIHRCIAHYAEFIANATGMTWQQAGDEAMHFAPAIDKFRPDYLEEMKGIAEGAGVSFADILAINCRSELFAMKMDKPSELEPECTAFAIMPSASKNGHVLAGQTWDFMYPLRDCMVIVHIAQDDKPDILLFTEAGFIGGKGMNSCGVSLTLNAMQAGHDWHGIPLHVKMRAALDSTYVAEAYGNAASGITAVGGNLILTSGDGVALSLEITPKGVDAILPENGMILHTNHMLSGMLLNKVPDGYRPRGSTFVRLTRLCERMRGKNDVDVEYMMSVLRDQGGYPNSIDVHISDKLPENRQGATNYGLIMDTTDKVAWFCAGNPSEGEFREYRI